MPLTQCMRSHTMRQLKVWMYYLNEEWGEATRLDYYLMQIAAEIRRGNVKNPRSVKLEHMLLKFNEKATKPKQSTASVAAMAKAKWLGRMTVPVKKVDKQLPLESPGLE